MTKLLGNGVTVCTYGFSVSYTWHLTVLIQQGLDSKSGNTAQKRVCALISVLDEIPSTLTLSGNTCNYQSLNHYRSDKKKQRDNVNSRKQWKPIPNANSEVNYS
jgi:hypothetical protein